VSTGADIRGERVRAGDAGFGVDTRPDGTRPCRAALDVILTSALVDILSSRIPVGSRVMQRGIGDIVEGHVTELVIEHIRRHSLPATASKPETKRSVEDLLLEVEGTTFYVDVKARDIDGTFSMPNLISIDRLEKLYRKDGNVLLLLMVEYSRDGDDIIVTDVRWKAVEEICWDSLAIQNLGKGQLQIRNAKRRLGRFEGDRAEWMRRFIAEGAAFYRAAAAKALEAEKVWLARIGKTDDAPADGIANGNAQLDLFGEDAA